MLYYFRMSAPSNNEEWKKMIASMPAVPKQPPGYHSKKENQRVFLNKVKSKTSTPFNLAMIPNRNLSEASYYAQELGNENAKTKIQKEQLRRIVPPFRLPEPSRPNMPLVPSDDIYRRLITTMYNPLSSPAKLHEAYSQFVDIYLTDWVNRKGFVNKNGETKMYTPFYGDAGFLTKLEVDIERLLRKEMTETPNPGTTKKMPGNSPRQKYFKHILELVQKRRENLMAEDFNRLTKRDREAASAKKGGRKTRKQKYNRRRHTRRN